MVTRNRRGKGEVWYYGAVFNEQAAAEIINLIDLQSPADWLELPEEVELQVRTGASSSYAFCLIIVRLLSRSIFMRPKQIY